MASLAELENIIRSLEGFHKSLGEEIERLKETYNPEVKTNLIKKIQAHIFDTALKIPFDLKFH